jgi:hypothetical protein
VSALLGPPLRLFWDLLIKLQNLTTMPTLTAYARIYGRSIGSRRIAEMAAWIAAAADAVKTDGFRLRYQRCQE